MTITIITKLTNITGGSSLASSAATQQLRQTTKARLITKYSRRRKTTTTTSQLPRGPAGSVRLMPQRQAKARAQRTVRDKQVTEAIGADKLRQGEAGAANPIDETMDEVEQDSIMMTTQEANKKVITPGGYDMARTTQRMEDENGTTTRYTSAINNSTTHDTTQSTGDDITQTGNHGHVQLLDDISPPTAHANPVNTSDRIPRMMGSTQAGTSTNLFHSTAAETSTTTNAEPTDNRHRTSTATLPNRGTTCASTKNTTSALTSSPSNHEPTPLDDTIAQAVGPGPG